MITNAQLAREIEKKLNRINNGTPSDPTDDTAGTINGRPFAFKVHSNNGEYQAFANDGTQRNRSTVLVNAVLGEQISTPLPLQGLGSTLISQTLSFIIPIDLDLRTGSADYALQAINLFVQDVAGLAGTMSDGTNTYSYVLSVSTPYVGQEAYTVGTQSGRCVPATCQVSWQFILDGVVANNVILKLNGDRVTLLDGAITRTRVGDAVNVEGSQEMQTAITQQGLLWRIVTPYKRGDVSQTLYEHMLTGGLAQRYLLEYDDRERDENDDIISGARGFYITQYVVAKEISVATTAGKGITLTATLVPAR